MTNCCDHPHSDPADPVGSADSPGAPAPVLAPLAAGAVRFRVPAMDCSAEESDIRRVLEPIAGIRSLQFQLVARTLTIDASAEALALAVAAIGKAGYKMLPFTAADASGAGADHHDHDHTHAPAAAQGSGLPPGLPRLIAALVLAGVAEGLSFLAPAGAWWTAAGMAIALAAILLAGLDVYKKGVGALLRRRLNINALMTVAVTGAFLIGQWPELSLIHI